MSCKNRRDKMYSLYCKRCGRKLKSEESRNRGYGSYCYNKICKDEKRNTIKQEKVENIDGQLDFIEKKEEE